MEVLVPAWTFWNHRRKVHPRSGSRIRVVRTLDLGINVLLPYYLPQSLGILWGSVLILGGEVSQILLSSIFSISHILCLFLSLSPISHGDYSASLEENSDTLIILSPIPTSLCTCERISYWSATLPVGLPSRFEYYEVVWRWLHVFYYFINKN